MQEFIIVLLGSIFSFLSSVTYAVEDGVQQLLPQIQQTITANEPYIQQFKQKLIEEAEMLHLLPDSQAAELGEQLTEVIHDISGLNPSLIQENLGIRQLTPISGTDNYSTGGKINIIAGDHDISHSLLVSIGHLVDEVSLPALKENMGATPTKHTRIVLFSTPESYAQALRQAGISKAQARQMVKATGGLTIQSEIWIPLYAAHGKSERANILTHELTHVVFNQQGIGNRLPIWINEGMAWHNGMAGKKRINPEAEDRERAQLNEELRVVAASGQLLPLTADENDIIHASYNVEWEDYIAVQYLMQTYGESKMHEFLSGVRTLGAEISFLRTFHIPLHTFEQKFYESIQ
jgi:hypothetical protein